MRNSQYLAVNKRDKVRARNAKKHQRRKEKRAEELRKQCCSTLKSRKLETMAQQIVAMGYSYEQAKTALFLNQGSVEQSTTWLLEGNKEGSSESKEQNLDELDIDVSEELDRIKEVETRYKASTRDIHRIVVSCKGDLGKVEQLLESCAGDIDMAAATLRQEENAAKKNAQLALACASLPASTPQKSDDAKVATLDAATKSGQMLKNPAPKTDLVAKPLDKRWGTVRSNPPLSYSSALAPPTAWEEPQYLSITNDLMNLQLGSGSAGPAKATQPPPTTPKEDSWVSHGSSLPGLASYHWNPNYPDIHDVKPPVATSSSYSPAAPLDSMSSSYSAVSHSNIHEANLYSSQGTSKGVGSLSSTSLGLFSGAPESSSSTDRNKFSSSPQTHLNRVHWSTSSRISEAGWAIDGANYPEIWDDHFSLGTLTNSRQLDSFGPDIMANSRQLVEIGPSAMINSRQLDALDPRTMANSRPSMMANLRQLDDIGPSAMTNSRELDAFGPRMMANSRPSMMDNSILGNSVADVVVPRPAGPREQGGGLENLPETFPNEADVRVPQPASPRWPSCLSDWVVPDQERNETDFQVPQPASSRWPISQPTSPRCPSSQPASPRCPSSQPASSRCPSSQPASSRCPSSQPASPRCPSSLSDWEVPAHERNEADFQVPQPASPSSQPASPRWHSSLSDWVVPDQERL